VSDKLKDWAIGKYQHEPQASESRERQKITRWRFVLVLLARQDVKVTGQYGFELKALPRFFRTRVLTTHWRIRHGKAFGNTVHRTDLLALGKEDTLS
jgi:hypothetical protein